MNDFGLSWRMRDSANGEIGAFVGADGRRRALHSDASGQPATLEEIVLGHLASGRAAKDQVN